MNPNPQQRQAIRDFAAALAGGWSNTDPQIRAAMTTTLVANPVTTAPQVPKPYDVDDLIAAVATANQVNVSNLAVTMPTFLVDVDNRDLARLRRWARLLKALGKLTAADVTALGAVVVATQADPTWTATVPWDVANLGRVADDFDIEAARSSA